MNEATDMGVELADLPPISVPPMSEALRAAVQDASPVSLRRPLRELGVFLIFSVPLFALLLASMGFRRDLTGLSPLWVGSVALVWLAGFAASAYIGFVPAKGHIRPRSQSAYRIVIVASLLLISIGLFATQSVSGHSMTYPATVSNVLAHAPKCSMMGITAGIVPGLLALVLMRRFVPIGAISVGLSLGAAGGCLSGLVLHLHCPISERFHVGLVHGGCLVLSALFVAGASRVLLRER